MKKGQVLKNFILLSLIFFLSSHLFAQEYLNADSLFLAAHEKAVDGQYQEAIEMADQVLDKFPDYTDVILFKARTLAWDKQYDLAIKEISDLLEKEPENLNANISLCEFYLWASEYKPAVEAANKALNLFPYNEDLLVKKAQAELELENYEETSKITNLINERYPGNQQASEIEEMTKMRMWRDELRFEHYFDGFNKPYERRWHMSSVGYGRKTKIGTYYGKVYFGDLVNSGESLYGSDVSKQFSLEFYPRINRNNYMFLNYSYSPDNLFPKNRVGLEYYHVFKNKFEASIGYRYMRFEDDISPAVNINIFTGSLAKYMGNWWVSARPYIIDNGVDISYKYSLEVRKYFNPEVSYLKLSGGTGTSPENPAFYTGGAQRATLDSWNLSLEWKQRVAKSLSFELETGYENTEYEKNKRRDQLILRASLSFLF
ncbi:YaiO family outer membrane beta-barrel protein [Sunxiuqinia sp. A32]|uniref:YaiO family outer membrane beta-barrel protein n=1 Tax=Sunxiuqinia sp. A32 TaxID=3461496 RepID=UPI0040458C53